MDSSFAQGEMRSHLGDCVRLALAKQRGLVHRLGVALHLTRSLADKLAVLLGAKSKRYTALPGPLLQLRQVLLVNTESGKHVHDG